MGMWAQAQGGGGGVDGGTQPTSNVPGDEISCEGAKLLSRIGSPRLGIGSYLVSKELQPVQTSWKPSDPKCKKNISALTHMLDLWGSRVLGSKVQKSSLSGGV